MRKYIFFIVLICIGLANQSVAQNIIWSENFATPEKGYWGGGSDIVGITNWTLDVTNCTLTDANDYIKTVSTGGGRMEAKDIDGEAVWTSEAIDISSNPNVL